MSEPSATAEVPPDCLELPHLVRTRSYTLGPESDVGNIECKYHFINVVARSCKRRYENRGTHFRISVRVCSDVCLGA